MTSVQRDQLERDHVRFLSFLAAVSITIFWILPIGSSLWLDETVTYWVARKDLVHAVSTAIRFKQSPGFAVVERGVVASGARSEWLLRLPSLIAMGFACYVMYRIAVRLFGRSAAIAALLVFVMAPNVTFSAGDARPYAIGLLAALTSALFLLRWGDGQRLRDGIACAFAAAIAIYMHYLFALMIVAQFAYLIPRGATARPSRARVLALVAGMLVLISPLTTVLVSLWRDRRGVSVPAPDAWGTLVRAIAPPVLLAGIFLGLSFTALFERWQLRRETADRRALSFAFSLFLFPSIALYVFSRTSGATLFADRYFLLTIPGLALLVGWGLSRIDSRRAQRIALLAVFVLSAISYAKTSHTPEGWREATEAANRASGTQSIPILVHAGLIESNQISWLNDPAKVNYLDAPLTYYPVKGTVITLPYATAPGSIDYLKRIVDGDLLRSRRFVLIAAYQSSFLRTWLDARLAAEGFTSRTLYGTGSVQTVLYEK